MTIETKNSSLTPGMRALLSCGMALLTTAASQAKAGTLCGGYGEAPCCDCCACAIPCLCGFCNCVCDPGLVETFGFCYPPCGGNGEPCCGTDCTCDSQWLQQYFGICGPCGGESEPFCISGEPCRPGLVNILGFCSSPANCGGNGQIPCGSGDPCDPWLMIVGPVCAPCGDEGQVPCVPGLSTTPGCSYPNSIGADGTCRFYCDLDNVEGNCDYLITVGQAPLKWPDGVIYYAFTANVTEERKRLMRQAMDVWGGTAADLTFLPWDGAAPGYMEVSANPTGSSSAPAGWRPDVQPLNLNDLGWSDIGRPLHELGHILGMYHEHQRPDRNDYVEYICENLQQPPSEESFVPYAAHLWLYLHPQYDLLSIMHYPQCLGSRFNDAPGCPCPGGVCNWDDYFDDSEFDVFVRSAGRVMVVRNCDEATQQMVGDWAVNGLSAIDEEEMVYIYGSGTSVYVDPTLGGGQGTVADPYTSVQEGANAVSNAKVWIRGGSYSGHAGTYGVAGEWRAHNGIVTVQ